MLCTRTRFCDIQQHVDSEAWGIASAESSRRVQPPPPTRAHAFTPPHTFHPATTRWDPSAPCHVLAPERHGHLDGNPSHSGILPLHHDPPLVAMCLLHIPTPNSTPAEVSLDPFAKSTTPDIQRPWSQVSLRTSQLTPAMIRVLYRPLPSLVRSWMELETRSAKMSKITINLTH